MLFQVIEIWYEAPTFRYDPEEIQIGKGFKFIGTILSYIMTGAAVLFLILFLVFMTLGSPDFWYAFGDNIDIIGRYILFDVVFFFFVH